MHKQEMKIQASPGSRGPCAAPMLGDPVDKAPISPWMPFSMLFAAISTKVSPNSMDLVISCYEEFKVWYLLVVIFSIGCALSGVFELTYVCMYLFLPEQENKPG
jgi:hypothetical protein